MTSEWQALEPLGHPIRKLYHSTFPMFRPASVTKEQTPQNFKNKNRRVNPRAPKFNSTHHAETAIRPSEFPCKTQQTGQGKSIPHASNPPLQAERGSKIPGGKIPTREVQHHGGGRLLQKYSGQSRCCSVPPG